MYHNRAQIEEYVKRAAGPVRPTSFMTPISRSQNHFKLLGRTERRSDGLGFICALGFFAVSLPVTIVFFVLGAIYEEDLPLWLLALIGSVVIGTTLLLAVLPIHLWQRKNPLLVKWCNKKQTITYVFNRRLRTHRYVFSYKDCIGLHLREWEGENSGRMLQMAIRFSAKGKAGDGFRARRDAMRNFTVAPAAGRFGPLCDPIRWSDEYRPGAETRGWLSVLVAWIGKLNREMQAGNGCEFFDLTNPDAWNGQDLDEVRKAIAEVTGLPASVPHAALTPAGRGTALEPPRRS